MAATTSYTVSYKTASSSAASLKLYSKANKTVSFSPILPNINNPVPNQVYTKFFSSLNSHTVHQVISTIDCDIEGPVIVGDISYLYNPICNPITVIDGGTALTVEWDCYTSNDGDSVSQYRFEYKEVGSPNPFNIVTIPMTQIVTYWNANPGSYPSYSTQLTTGISPGLVYEINMYITLTYDFYTSATTYSPLNQTIGPCTTIFGLTSSAALLEEGGAALEEEDGISLLEE